MTGHGAQECAGTNGREIESLDGFYLRRKANKIDKRHMPKLLIRAIALLLVPCLFVDPTIVMASMGPQSISGRRGDLPLQFPFTSQALAAHVVSVARHLRLPGGDVTSRVWHWLSPRLREFSASEQGEQLPSSHDSSLSELIAKVLETYADNLSPVSAVFLSIDALADYVKDHLEMAPRVVDDLFMPEDLDLVVQFIEMLSARDPTRLKFDMSIPPESLFPMQEISTWLSNQGRAGTLKVRRGTADSEDRRQLSLILIENGAEQSIADIDIQTRNKLIFDRPHETILSFIQQVVWRTGSGSRGNKVQTFYNLNWMASIHHFEMHAGLFGEVWYLQYVEPYLRRCGFTAVVVEGKCQGTPWTKAFYSRMGFSQEFNVDPARDADKTQSYLSFKTLTQTVETATSSGAHPAAPASSVTPPFPKAFSLALPGKTNMEFHQKYGSGGLYLYEGVVNGYKCEFTFALDNPGQISWRNVKVHPKVRQEVGTMIGFWLSQQSLLRYPKSRKPLEMSFLFNPTMLDIAYRLYRPDSIEIYTRDSEGWIPLSEADVYHAFGPLQIKSSELGVENAYMNREIRIVRDGDHYRVLEKPQEVDVALNGPLLTVRDTTSKQRLKSIESAHSIWLRGEPAEAASLSADLEPGAARLKAGPSPSPMRPPSDSRDRNKIGKHIKEIDELLMAVQSVLEMMPDLSLRNGLFVLLEKIDRSLAAFQRNIPEFQMAHFSFQAVFSKIKNYSFEVGRTDLEDNLRSLYALLQSHRRRLAGSA